MGLESFALAELVCCQKVQASIKAFSFGTEFLGIHRLADENSCPGILRPLSSSGT